MIPRAIVNEIIRLYTEAPGLTQTELASKFNLNQSTVSRVLKGRKRYKVPVDIEARRAKWRIARAAQRANYWKRYSYE
jgi:transcriptional regulator with XRE-family HTH domain